MGRRRHGLLPVPLLAHGAGHRPRGGADGPASGSPRRARPPSADLPAGVRRGRRAGVPDRGRAAPGGRHLPGGQPPSAPARPRCRRPRGGRSVRRRCRRRSVTGARGPVPRLPGPGRRPQGDPRPGRVLLPLQGTPPRSSPPGAGRAGGRRTPGAPGHRRARRGGRGGQVGPAGPGRRPGQPVAVGGLLVGGGRVVERPHPRTRQRRLCSHGGALPAFRRWCHLRRLRRVRGGRRPADRGGRLRHHPRTAGT